MSANSPSDQQDVGGSVGRRAVLTSGAVVGAALVGALGVAGAGTAAAATSASTAKKGTDNEAAATGVAKNADEARVRFDRWTTWSDFRVRGVRRHPGVAGAAAGRRHRGTGGHHVLHRPLSRTPPRVRVRDVDLPGPPPGLRRHPADRALERRHPEGHVPEGGTAGHDGGRPPRHLDDGCLDPRRQRARPHLGERPEQRLWRGRHRHVERRDRARDAFLPTAPDSVAPPRIARQSPRVWQIGATASAVPSRTTVPASTPGPATGITLAVKPYAQNLHKGQYVEYGGGGEAWCSPTSTEMVVEFWGKGSEQRAGGVGRPELRRPVGGPGGAVQLRLRLPGHRELAVHLRLRRFVRPGRDGRSAELADGAGDPCRRRVPGGHVAVASRRPRTATTRATGTCGASSGSRTPAT